MGVSKTHRRGDPRGFFTLPLYRRLGLRSSNVSQGRFPHLFWSFAVVGAVVIGLWGSAFRGWIPLDEGTLGLAASNVLDGLWPHVDFGDPYPGLQGFAHAAVFSLIGESIASLRFAWLAMAAIAGVASYVLLRRYVDSMVAAMGSFGIVVISFIRYPASMPSWWNVSLGLATLALAIEARRRSSVLMISIAGLLTGINLLIKPTALYFAIPLFLWLLVDSRIASRPVASSALVASMVVVTLILAPVWSISRLVLLWLPIAVVLVALVAPTFVRTESQSSNRARIPLTFAATGALPPVVVAVGYMIPGEFQALIEGWVLSPARRFEHFANAVPFTWSGLILVAGITGVFWLVHKRDLSIWIAVLPFAALSFAAIVAFGNVGTVVLFAIVWLPPVLALLAIKRPNGDRSMEAVVVAACAVTFSLIQVPDFGQYYIAYSTPALLIGLIVLCGTFSRPLIYGVFVVAIAFAWLGWADRLFGAHTYGDSVETVALELPRGGISIWDHHSFYAELSERIAEESPDGPIYAGPDSPEVLFLSEVESASPAFFEALTEGWEESEIVELATHVDLVAINRDPFVTPAISDSVLDRLGVIYPKEESIGNFTLYSRS